jgi:hypothetical protein
MGPVVMVFLSVVVGGLGILVSVRLLAVFVKGCREKDTRLQLLGGVPFLMCVAAGLYLILHDRVVPLDQQARNLLMLPAEAKVLKVEHGDWAGDGSVEFTLPNTQSPEQWLNTVWKANPMKPEDESNSTRYSRASHSAVHNHALEYLPKTKTYHYSIQYN